MKCAILLLLLGMVWLSRAYPMDEIEDEGDFLVRIRREAMSPDADADPDAFPDAFPGRSQDSLFGYKKTKKFYNAKNLGAFG
ncbi:unnamed protein product [Darwinula stevensoni]|uniref:Uncharacterized protein n=1 Tax=Darwinula stevensoni TaxID=69355 RepID=A0A7R9AFR3_9CRUS|nr:unnamed protein product [Darwinula stevensoni]CAG0902677.1 unnamed protein product [Darwinula stevensoni]